MYTTILSGGRAGGRFMAVKALIDAGLDIMIVVPDEEARDRVRKCGIPDRLITVARKMTNDPYDVIRNYTFTSHTPLS